MLALKEKVTEAASALEGKLSGYKPQTAVILGSGFAEVITDVEMSVKIPYAEIPHFPQTSVKGHRGLFSVGKVQGKEVLFMQGRFHFYEGHDMRMIGLPIRVMRSVGINTLILTNAAGSIKESYKPGDLMVLSDHINLTLHNPLAASDSDVFGPQFIDTSETYNEEMRANALQVAQDYPLTVHSGVYVYTTGPSYETPAEIKMMRTLGGDVVGMSTFPEALVAHQAGMRVFGLSLVSNFGSGISSQQLHHDEIIETMSAIRVPASRYLSTLIAQF